MKKIVISLLGLGVIGLANAGESIATTKTTATMQATCSISVAPVGFGVVATPLISQSANSEMSVKCSNTSAYTIDLAYGGIYGQGSAPSGYTLEYRSDSGGQYHNYYIYNSSNVNQGVIRCGFYSNVGKVAFNNQVSANLYGYATNDGGLWLQDTKGVCQSNNTVAGTYPKGWTGAYNASGNQPVGGPGYAYGVMQGSFKGDSLAYSVAVPGEPTKVWNAGNNSYKNTGNGDFQVIPVVAKIVPDKSGSKYPAPDMYLDTITAVISY